MINKIRTSYFGWAKHFDPDKFCLIGIAGKSPEGWTSPEYKKLAPSWSIYKEWHDAREKCSGSQDEIRAIDKHYTYRFFTERLEKLSASDVIHDFETIADGKVPVLLCYEKPGAFCHRHLVARWLIANFPDLDVAEAF